eukprot:6430285-Pyramimonas_sp.AAC.1
MYIHRSQPQNVLQLSGGCQWTEGRRGPTTPTISLNQFSPPNRLCRSVELSQPMRLCRSVTPAMTKSRGLGLTQITPWITVSRRRNWRPRTR